MYTVLQYTICIYLTKKNKMLFINKILKLFKKEKPTNSYKNLCLSGFYIAYATSSFHDMKINEKKKWQQNSIHIDNYNLLHIS